MFRDRVKELATTTGTGNFTLAGAVTGFRTFNAAIGVGPFFVYVIAGTGAIEAEWEVGIGHLSGTTTLVRDRVESSSNAGALVSFSAGTKNVFIDASAAPILLSFSTAAIGAVHSLR